MKPLKIFLTAILFQIVFAPSALPSSGPGPDALFHQYQALESRLENNVFGFPLYLESADRAGTLHVDVYGIFDHPFDALTQVLTVAPNWCDIAALHPNVKACTVSGGKGTPVLTMYNGRKFYQEPGDAVRLTYAYRKLESRQDYLDVALTADSGPFGTKDHKMRIEALPVGKNRAFVHVSYEYRYGLSFRLAEKIYFATVGQEKIGFTVNGADGSGRPLYVKGPRAAIERNAVRYYLAIKSFLDTMQWPEERRFSQRLNEWYDLTDHFRKQLFELEKKDYLAFKTEEHKNQERLQAEISSKAH